MTAHPYVEMWETVQRSARDLVESLYPRRATAEELDLHAASYEPIRPVRPFLAASSLPMGQDLHPSHTLPGHLHSGFPHDVDVVLWALYHAVVEEKIAKRGADDVLRSFLVDEDKKDRTCRELSETDAWKRYTEAVKRVEAIRKDLFSAIEGWAVGTAAKAGP